MPDWTPRHTPLFPKNLICCRLESWHLSAPCFVQEAYTSGESKELSNVVGTTIDYHAAAWFAALLSDLEQIC